MRGSVRFGLLSDATFYHPLQLESTKSNRQVRLQVGKSLPKRKLTGLIIDGTGTV